MRSADSRSTICKKEALDNVEMEFLGHLQTRGGEAARRRRAGTQLMNVLDAADGVGTTIARLPKDICEKIAGYLDDPSRQRVMQTWVGCAKPESLQSLADAAAVKCGFPSTFRVDGWEENVEKLSLCGSDKTATLAKLFGVFREAPYKPMTNPDEAAKVAWAAIKLFPDDEDIVQRGIQLAPFTFQFASNRIRNDMEIVERSAHFDPSTFIYSSERIQNNLRFFSALMQRDPHIYPFGGQGLKSDRKLAQLALAERIGNGYNRTSYREVKYFRDDREIMLSLLKIKGIDLKWLSNDFKGDREMVLAAVKNCGGALKYADLQLREDLDIVRAAVMKDGDALEFAGMGPRADREIIRIALANPHFGVDLSLYSNELAKNDPELLTLQKKFLDDYEEHLYLAGSF